MKRFILSIMLVAVALIAVAESRTDKLLRELHNPKSDYVFVIAHRADWRNFPENSLEAIESAIAMGVDIVELDVHRTADGEIVVCHDKTINRTTNGKGKISELTLDYIRSRYLRAGHGATTRYKMPTLAEALDVCKGRVLINLDKAINYYDQIMEMLVERKMADQVIMKSSKSPAAMKEFFSHHKQNMLYMPIINYNTKSWGKHEQLFNDYLATDLPFIAFEMCWNGSLPGEKKVFNRVLKSGKRLWINTLWGKLCGGYENGYYDDRAVGNEDKIYGKILSYGASMIQTDRPAMLIKYLESKGRHALK
ncbi:MAG: glycerophosphodiester phosphodiesterase family protein [Alistipes sp.]|nr:glycerophosphodiester phosphodiesterase family protein [Alistipes sp.]